MSRERLCDRIRIYLFICKTIIVPIKVDGKCEGSVGMATATTGTLRAFLLSSSRAAVTGQTWRMEGLFEQKLYALRSEKKRPSIPSDNIFICSFVALNFSLFHFAVLSLSQGKVPKWRLNSPEGWVCNVNDAINVFQE